MVIVIISLIIAVLVTGGAIAIASYAGFLTEKVSGENLLYIDVEKGYKYATTFRDWQLYGNIAVAVAIVCWIIFIIILVKRIKKKRKIVTKMPS